MKSDTNENERIIRNAAQHYAEFLKIEAAKAHHEGNMYVAANLRASAGEIINALKETEKKNG